MPCNRCRKIHEYTLALPILQTGIYPPNQVSLLHIFGGPLCFLEQCVSIKDTNIEWFCEPFSFVIPCPVHCLLRAAFHTLQTDRSRNMSCAIAFVIVKFLGYHYLPHPTMHG